MSKLNHKNIYFYSLIASMLLHLFIISCSNRGQNTKIVLAKNGQKSNMIIRLKTPQKRVAKIIKKAPQKQKKQSNITEKSQGQNSALANYLDRIRQIVAQKKHYPIIAKRLGQQGFVKIALNIDSSGKILEKKIEDPSRFDLLNSAVQNMIKKLDKVDQFPKEISSKTIKLKIPIQFKL